MLCQNCWTSFLNFCILPSNICNQDFNGKSSVTSLRLKLAGTEEISECEVIVWVPTENGGITLLFIQPSSTVIDLFVSTNYISFFCTVTNWTISMYVKMVAFSVCHMRITWSPHFISYQRWPIERCVSDSNLQ